MARTFVGHIRQVIAAISRRALSRDRLRSPTIWLSLFVATAGLSIGGVELWHELSQRDLEIAQTKLAARNLARSLAQHADDTFEMADRVLSGVVERIEADGTSAVALARIERLGQRFTQAPSRLRGLFVYDENGAWLVNSLGGSPPDANNSDRAYFKSHRASEDREALLGTAVQSRTQGQWVVTISRRFNHPDGRFAGVAAITIDVGYFSKLYGEFDIGSNGTVTLIRKDGAVLARYPHDAAFAGRFLPPTSMYYLDKDVTSGARRYRASVDGIDRIGGFQHGKRFPIVVSTAVSIDEALAGWRAGAIMRSSVAGLLGLLIVFMGWRLVRYVVRQRRTEASLKASEADFRLLAENSDDMVVRIGPDGIRRYVSPASTKLLGLTPEQLVGRPVREQIEAEDIPTVRREIKRLRSGEIESAHFAYRVRRPDGTIVWLESAVRTAVDSLSGESEGMVAITRDVTARKRLEGELTALARTDGLTGLANRRMFDEALEMEFARAKRDGTVLSLVLIDLDHFKVYNDAYGHQAGDDCLITVGEILNWHTRRPGDTAARYGGEEFALLLPNTPAAGASIVAENIRVALEGRGLAHAGQAPRSTMTLSAGVADETAFDETASPADLISRADRELYRAKSLGRNCISLSSRIERNRRSQATVSRTGVGGSSPGQQVVDAAVRVSGDDAGDDVGEVYGAFDRNELAGLDRRSDHRPVAGAADRAGDEAVLSSSRRVA